MGSRNAPVADRLRATLTRRGDLKSVTFATATSPDRPGHAEHTYPLVRRDHCGRRVGNLLKRNCLAVEHELTEVTTWPQQHNAGMPKEPLGCTCRQVSISMRRPLVDLSAKADDTSSSDNDAQACCLRGARALS